VTSVGLRLDQAPPFSVPLRFFLTAPLFGAAAAIVVLIEGPEIFLSRWHPTLLAVTHLLTLGVLTMVMLGALMQMLPVLAGIPVRRPVGVAAVVHALLVVGTITIALSFWSSFTALRAVGLITLGIGVGIFFLVAGESLARAVANPSVTAMRLALLAFAVVALLGIYTGSPWAPTQASLALRVTDAHLVWGLVGWVALLIIGVAYQVVPMFQLTRAYPTWLRPGLVPAVFAMLILWSGAAVVTPTSATGVEITIALFIAAALALFAVVTLRLQMTRQRRLPDATVRFWFLAMVSLFACAALWAVRAVGLVTDERSLILIGAWMIIGFAASTIIGMLYKIVPFLAWLHLQARLESAAPHMKEFLPDAPALAHAWLHGAALVLLAPAIWAPGPWLYPAAGALLVSFLWLGANLVRAVRVYRRFAMPIKG